MIDSPKPLTVTLMTDWGTGPLWVGFGDGPDSTYLVDEITEVVPISAELLAAIDAWDEQYQSTYNKAQPQDSGILDPAEQAAFNAVGRQLARRLRDELPAEIAVSYVSLDGEETPVETGQSHSGG
jgi:GTPase Era involved in 16S rRNA processing